MISISGNILISADTKGLCPPTEHTRILDVQDVPVSTLTVPASKLGSPTLILAVFRGNVN